MRTLAAILLLMTIATPAAADGDIPPTHMPDIRNPRLRPYDTRAAAALRDGLERSPTIRHIVSELERRDVIAYVETRFMDRELAGSLTWLARTGPYRYVRLSLNRQLTKGRLVATLGHELQHALEVARTPSIVDANTLEAFYESHGVRVNTHERGWDTEAARVTGDEVWKELKLAPANDAGTRQE